MERREAVKVKSGKQYDHLFPRAGLVTITKKEGASVTDTIRFIPQVVKETLFHTEKIARLLKRKTTYDTCKAIWNFVYEHIAYKKDEDGKEQIRSPARTWHDRGNGQGVDCDCYTTFISSILSNLKIRHVLRITKYKQDYFQHIYPIVPLDDGSYITVDCVVKQFDYEEPYSEKKDTSMDLEYLNGISLSGAYDDREAMMALGKIFKRKAAAAKPAAKKAAKPPKKKFGAKLKKVLKKGLHVTNRFNPATVLLRAGILAAAKLNVMKVASRLKYAYLSDAEASKRGIDRNKFIKLKSVKDKLEKIFYGTGGKPENLKQAILKGKGNKNREVSGLGYMVEPMEGMSEYTPISELLGTDIYQSEISGVYGFGELGEPATAAALAAASSVIGVIAGLLKSIGNIFTKKSAASKDFEEGATSATADSGSSSGDGEESATDNSGSSSPSVIVSSPRTSIKKIIPRTSSPGKTKITSGSSSTTTTNSEENADKAVDEGSSTPETSSSLPDKSDSAVTPTETNETAEADSNINGKVKSTGVSTNEGSTTVSFWIKNKKWLLPTSIGIGVLLISYVGYKAMSSGKKHTSSLSGVTKSKKRKKKKWKRPGIKSKKHKQAVALL